MAILRGALNRHRLLLALLCMGVSACQGSNLASLFHPGAAPVPEVKPGHPKAILPPLTSHAATGESPQPAKPKATSEEEKAPAANPAKEEVKAPVLKLAPVGNPAVDATARQQAEQAVDEATRRLAMVDRSKLAGHKAANYDLVAGFIEGAQQALQEQDFVRAQSLAEKASVLAAQLSNRVTPTP